MPTVASKLRLDLSYNLLRGTIPFAATLHMAPYVEMLLLTHNMIEGSIPQDLLKAMGTCFRSIVNVSDSKAGTRKTQLSGTKFDETKTRYEYRAV